MALLSLLAIGFCESLAARGLAGKPHGGTASFHVAVLDAKGTSVAGDSGHAGGAHSINREYKPGDRIEVTGSQRMAVRLDEKMPECLHQGAIAHQLRHSEIKKQVSDLSAGRVQKSNEAHRRVDNCTDIAVLS
jgi:hypothetical protein